MMVGLLHISPVPRDTLRSCRTDTERTRAQNIIAGDECDDECKVLELLKEQPGVELAQRDRWGSTPMRDAKINGQEDVVAWLRSNGVPELEAPEVLGRRGWRGLQGCWCGWSDAGRVGVDAKVNQLEGSFFHAAGVGDVEVAPH